MLTKLLVTICFTLMVLGMTITTHAQDRQLAHMVFFKLKDSSEASKQQLIEACHEYLSDHDGVVYFSVGALAEEFKREVNDLDFDVSLHLVFADKAAHDKYQTHERHLKFIEQGRDNWDNVRVFDSYLTAGKSGSASKGRAKKAKSSP